MKFINETHNIQYFHQKSKRFISEAEALNISSNFNLPSYYNFISNGLNTLRRSGRYKYFCGLAAIPPRTTISVTNEYYQICGNLDKSCIRKGYNSKTLLNHANEIFDKFKYKKIAVELSGGLDSSLIIEFLLANKVDPILIGFESSAFEFRTERAVQNHYSNLVSKSILLPYDSHPAFSDLKSTPPHPIPVTESHLHNRHSVMAQTAREHGVEVLFSGEAGDQLLSYPVELKLSAELPIDFGYWCLAEHWSNEYVYKPVNVQYLSGLALGNLPAIFLSLRYGEKFDPMKIWARKYFRKCLPKNLSSYAYTAFHNSWINNGLKNASNEISSISELAFEKTNIYELSPACMKEKAMIYGLLDEDSRRMFLCQLAFITWFYSHVNYSRIK